MNVGLLKRLSASPVDYRHALAILDPEYQEWRPEGKPRHRLDHVAGAALLMDEANDICYLLGELSQASAAPVAAFVSRCGMAELNVASEVSYGLLRPYLANGQWRHSRNYEAVAEGFVARPCGAVRLLTSTDRPLLEAAGQEALHVSPTRRSPVDAR